MKYAVVFTYPADTAKIQATQLIQDAPCYKAGVFAGYTSYPWTQVF